MLGPGMSKQLIEPRQESFALGRAQPFGDQLRLFPVISLRTDADPVAAVEPWKLDHRLARIALQQLRLQADGPALGVKRPNLHAPAPARFDRLGRLVDIESH